MSRQQIGTVSKHQRAQALARLVRHADEGINWRVEDQDLMAGNGLFETELFDELKLRARLLVLIPCTILLTVACFMMLRSDQESGIYFWAAFLSALIYCGTLIMLRRRKTYLPLVPVLPLGLVGTIFCQFCIASLIRPALMPLLHGNGSGMLLAPIIGAFSACTMKTLYIPAQFNASD